MTPNPILRSSKSSETVKDKHTVTTDY